MLTGQLPQQQTAKFATESLVDAEGGHLSGPSENLVEQGIVCFQLHRIRKIQGGEEALEMLKVTTKFDGERYEVGVLWKNVKPHLQNIYSSAVSQLKSLECRLEKDENLRQRYQETIDVDVKRDS